MDIQFSVVAPEGKKIGFNRLSTWGQYTNKHKYVSLELLYVDVELMKQY